jgi:hypothetical protein
MVTLDGQDVFGLAVVCPPPAINPRRDQKANYPGLNGTESLDMGDQGAYSTVSGRLVGADKGAYAAAVIALMSFYDGEAHELTDNDGFTWPAAKMESLEWHDDRGMFDPDLGFTRRYTCRFFHLVLL